MTAWEYKLATREEETPLTEEQFNAAGQAGWELIGVVITTHEVVVIGRQERRNRIHYFFKRPRPPAATGKPAAGGPAGK
jgi:hypothetical protein